MTVTLPGPPRTEAAPRGYWRGVEEIPRNWGRSQDVDGEVDGRGARHRLAERQHQDRVGAVLAGELGAAVQIDFLGSA